MGVAVEQQGREMKGLVAWVGVAVERQGREMKGLKARVGNKIATWLEHVPPEREGGGGYLPSTDSIRPLDRIECLDRQLITVISLLLADLVTCFWMGVCQCGTC